MRNKRAYVLLAMVLLIAFSCAQMQIKPIADMTPKEKALAAMKSYNHLVDGYKAKLALPDLSAAEKKVLQAEYATIQRTWPVIKAYDDYVQGVTTTLDETIIMQINQFLTTYRY